MTGRSTRRLPAVLYFFFLSLYFLCLCFDVTANKYRLIEKKKKKTDICGRGNIFLVFTCFWEGK